MTLNIGKIPEALRELTYEQEIFPKRVEDLSKLMKKDALKGIEAFLDFFLKAFIPHMENEENNLFPIATSQWSKKNLIKELADEHKILMKKYKQIRENLTGGKIVESAKLIKKSIEILKKHIEKEKPLYQLLLNEILEKP